MDKTSIRKQDSVAAQATGTSEASTPPRQFFRASSRVFCLNGEWYFQTREADHGPFTKREAAELALDRYVTEMQDMELITGSYPSVEGPVAADESKPAMQLELKIL